MHVLFGLLARLFNTDDDDADTLRPQVEGNPPCFFLLHDDSVSMGTKDGPGRTSRREAARGAGYGTLSYIYKNNPRAVVGIGSYADYFYHVTGPRVIGEHYQAMMDDLQDLGPTGDTAIGRGLRGIQKMIQKCPAESRKILLVLSDGRQNEGEAPEPVAEELREEYGVDIHAIGIGDRSEVDEDRLRRIASCPDQYTFLENWDPDGLLEEFTRVAQIIQTDEEG